MTRKEFNEFVTGFLDDCLRVLREKSEEYADDADVLIQFKLAGALRRQSPAQALIGMWIKHITAIITEIDGGVTRPGLLRERLIDNINYSLILWALLNEDVV